MEERSLQILALSRRQDGVTGKDVETAFGVGHRKAAAMLGELATRGHLHRCKVLKLLLHFFASPDAAAVWRARQVPPRKAPKPAPVVTMRSDCKTVVLPGWTHDARFQVAPGTFEGGPLIAQWRDLRRGPA
jgi:hypothetical protein